MKIANTAHSAKFLKRNAKALKKELGITHIEALNLAAQNHGYSDWKRFLKQSNFTPTTKPRLIRPKIPVPAVLNYLNTFTGAVIGQHPNTKMSAKRHKRVGDLLYELICAAEYHKRAKKYLQDIRGILDTWLGCEYDELSMDNAEFNQMYYSKGARSKFETNPSERRLAELKRKLREAKQIVDRSYHDCKPLEKLHQKFMMAEKSLEKWPTIKKMPDFNRLKGQLLPGTFVRLGNNKRLGLVFHHDKRTDTVEGYTDAGHFLYGRHEVSVMRQQPTLTDFKPMRLFLPYGKWSCVDGSEVLFNRDYSPIWERSVTGKISPISPDTYIQYINTVHYFDSGSAPYYGNQRSLETCMGVLEDWGVSGKYPKVLDLLQAALEAGDLGLLSPKGIS